MRHEVTALLAERMGVVVASPAQDLFESGALDSLSFVNLLVELEAAFGVQIVLETLDFDQFSTVDGIADFVASARHGAVARAG